MLQQLTPDSNASSRRRLPFVMLAVALVLTSALVPMSAAALAAGADTPDKAIDGVDTASIQEDNETASNESGDSTGPTDASQVRITPDIPDEDYVDAEVRESDESFNTSGGFATFSLSHSVDAARIPQEGASADVLGDGSVVRVSYEDEAAPRNTTSFYELELFFPDESQKTVDLYASNTAVSASTDLNPAWKPVIDYVTGAASAAGYGESPEDVENWIKDTEEKAQLFENFWSERISAYIGLKIAQVMNPIQWAAWIAIIAGISIYWSRKYGWILTLQQLSMPISKLQREAARQDYERSRKAAAQHKISDIADIGTNAARFWRSEMGIETVDDMIELACKGIVAKDENGNVLYDGNGDIVYAHHGVRDLMEVDPVTHRTLRDETWLRPILVDPRLNAATALANIERALRVAEKEYKRGNEVRQTRMQVEELIEELTATRTGTQTSVPDPQRTERKSPTGAGHGTPTGGD